MSRPFIIGITGGSGSGKTTLINQIKKEFSKQEICIVSQDDYYHPREEQITDEQGIKNFDRPESIDKHAFAFDVKKLIRGETVTRKEYVFNNELKEPKILVFEPAPIILVEGIFVFHFKEIRDLLDLKIFLHAKENLKVIRRIKRDQVERNYPLDDVLYRYEYHVLPTFEKYILPYKEEADLVINNNNNMEMGTKVLMGFFNHLLQS